MKKALLAALAVVSVMASGCASDTRITSVDNGWKIGEINAVISYPEGWSVFVGDELYEAVYNTYNDGFESAKDMQELMAMEGLQYLLYGCDEATGSAVTVSVQDMTVSEENPTAEEYARSVHDTTLFTYMANGYTTNGTGNFTEAVYAGISGYLSEYQLYNPEDDSFMLGGAEFMTQHGDNMYSIQVVYGTEEGKHEAVSVLDNITKG